MRILTYAKLTGPGSGGVGEEQSNPEVLEMGVPSARRTATERFGPPRTARSTAGTTPVRMSATADF